MISLFVPLPQSPSLPVSLFHTQIQQRLVTHPLFSLLSGGDNVNIDVFEQAEDLLCQGAFPEGLPA